MKHLPLWLAAASLLLAPAAGQAAYTIHNGKIVKRNAIPTLPPEEHFRLACEAMQSEEWKEAAKQFYIVSYNFPNLPGAEESCFYMGVCYIHTGEFDLANRAFSHYLVSRADPKFFDETIEYKMYIADQLRLGAKVRLGGFAQLPKLQSGSSLAIEVYDEIIAAVPSSEMAAQSLYSKAYLLWAMQEYRESIEVYQTLIKRFPKHELAPECYLLINKVYCDLAERETGNPDILVFAKINLRKFEEAFPREERIDAAQRDVIRIKEVYANGLYQTGCYFERVKKPEASVIYYQKALEEFPDTAVAQCCRNRIKVLAPKYAPSFLEPSESSAEFDIEPFTFSG